MGNHTVDCPVCKEDLRGSSCETGCPDNDRRYDKYSLKEKKEIWKKMKESVYTA
jgi:hypothetical protein